MADPYESMPHHCDCAAVRMAALVLGAYTATEHARRCGHEGSHWDEGYGPSLAASPTEGEEK